MKHNAASPWHIKHVESPQPQHAQTHTLPLVFLLPDSFWTSVYKVCVYFCECHQCDRWMNRLHASCQRAGVLKSEVLMRRSAVRVNSSFRLPPPASNCSARNDTGGMGPGASYALQGRWWQCLTHWNESIKVELCHSTITAGLLCNDCLNHFKVTTFVKFE